MHDWSPDLKARLSWTGCGVSGTPRRTVVIRLVHLTFLLKLARARLCLLSAPGLVLQVWPALAMELGSNPWFELTRSGVHRVSDLGYSDDQRVSQPRTSNSERLALRSAGIKGHASAQHSALERTEIGRFASGDGAGVVAVRRRVADGTHLPGPIDPARQPPAELGGRAAASVTHFTTGFLASNAAADRQNRRIDERRARPLMLHVTQFVRRDILPGTEGIRPGSAPLDRGVEMSTHADRTAPSTGGAPVDRIFAQANEPAALESVSVRILPSPQTEPLRHTGAKGHTGEWRAISPDTAARHSLHVRFSRAEIDQLVERVARIIKRRERLERESRGIL
jgi:hypothetical protein